MARTHASSGGDQQNFDPATTVRLVEVLEDYLERLRSSDAPPRDEFLAAHPELAGQLEDCLAGLEFIQAAEPPASLPGPQLGDFQIIREIGRGGMGAVYEAQQISLPRRVAVKVLRFGAVPDREALERFRREAETVAGLHHTNIVPIFSVGQENGVNYYAMQFIDGSSLADVAAREGASLDARRAAQWGLQAAEALAHAHQRGVIHRDVKPSNLLLDREQRIWLTDFGLAKRHDDVTLSLAGVLLGTPRYMSPEQASATQHPIDHRTDIYSLGATLYELLTGEPVFAGHSPHNVISQILTHEPRPPRQLRPSLPRDLETILLKCLAKRPADRYHSAGELADDLRAFLEERPIRARRASLAEQAARWWKRQQRSVVVTAYTALACLLLVTLSVAGALAWQAWQRSHVRLLSSQGVVTAEWFSAAKPFSHSLTSPILRQTLPVPDPTPFPAGRYEVRLSGDGKLSELWDIDLMRGEKREVAADLDHQYLWSDLTVPRDFDFFQHELGTDLVLFESDGLALLEGDRATEPRRTSLKFEDLRRLDELAGLVWPARESYGRDSQLDKQPHVVSPVIDLDGDGVGELVLAGKHQAWVLALSRDASTVLWARGLSEDLLQPADGPAEPHGSPYVVRSGILEAPMPVGDISGDGIEDLVVSVFALASNSEAPAAARPVRRWLEALSGADGKTLWKRELPDESFELVAGESIPDTGRMSVGPIWGMEATGGISSSLRWFMYRRPGRVQLTGDAIHVQGKLHLLPGGRQLALLAGKQVLVVNVAQGNWWAEPYELPWRTDLPLRWGHDQVSGEQFVLLVERQAMDPTSASPTARLGVYSLTKRRLLWSRAIDVFWPWPQAWHLEPPTWPLLVAPDDGQGGWDILVPSRTSVTMALGGGSSIPWGELACLDAMTGEARWERRIRTSDAQVDHFLIGPDLDGDGQGEVYVASVWGVRSELYVEALSRSTGEPLWIAHQPLSPAAEHMSNFHINRLQWWQASYRDSGPQLIVHVLPGGNHFTPETHALIQLISARDGTWTRSARNIHNSWLHDMDGDGVAELLTYQADIFEHPRSGVISCLQGVAGESWRLLNSGITVMQDVDHDGLLDLLQISSENRLTAMSGRDGRVLWRAQATAQATLQVQPVVPLNSWDAVPAAASASQSSQSRNVAGHRKFSSGDGTRMPTTSGDLDGDGIPDLIGFPAFTHIFSHPQPVLHAYSGRNGRPLWTAPIRVSHLQHVHGQVHGAMGVDLDRDGTTEIVLLAALDYEFPQFRFGSIDRTQLWCFVLSGRDGSIRWQQPLSRAYGLGPQLPGPGTALRQGTIELVYGDLNGDGVLDIVVPAEVASGEDAWELRALSGTDGQVLWRRPLAPHSVTDEVVARYVPPLLLDLNQEGQPAGVILEFADRSLSGESGLFARLTAFSRRDGSNCWSWETEVPPGTGNLRHSGRESLEQRPRPIAVQTGSATPPHIALNLWGGGSVGELVVISSNGDELGRVAVEQSGNAFRPWAFDIDGDGQDELILVNYDQLVAWRADSLGEPIWRQPIGVGWSRILGVMAERAGRPAVVVIESNPFDGRVRGFDAKTGEPAWVCAGPRRGQQSSRSRWDEVALLNPHDTDDSPRLAFRFEELIVCREAAGTRDRPRTHSTAVHPAVLPQKVRDPRMARPLPWRTNEPIESVLSGLLAIAWGIFYSFVLLLVPAGYLAITIRRRWSLRQLLMAPAVLALVLVAASINNSGIRDLDLPVTGVAAKFVAGFFLLPMCVFLVQCVWLVGTGRWMSLARWAMIAVVLSVLTAFVILHVQQGFSRMQLEPGEYYSWDGWYWIFGMGAYKAGVLMIVWFIARWFWSWFQKSSVRGVAHAS